MQKVFVTVGVANRSTFLTQRRLGGVRSFLWQAPTLGTLLNYMSFISSTPHLILFDGLFVVPTALLVGRRELRLELSIAAHRTLRHGATTFSDGVYLI